MYACMLSVKLSEEITRQTGTVASKITNKNVSELVKPVYSLQSSVLAFRLFGHSFRLGIQQFIRLEESKDFVVGR